MALFKILRGPSSGLDKLTINDGWCYYTPDTGLFHIDCNGTRVPLNAKDAQTLSGASLVQVLNSEGLDKEILSAAAVDEIKENLELLIAAKQEHITGTEGQVVVIGANGSPTAVNANLSTSGGIIDQNTGEIIKMWHGTVEEYDAIAEKDDNTIYILTDEVGGDIVANDIEYDNSVSGLLSTNVQNAIDELATTSIQPDWNQNDETAPDYIKNRPFYSENAVDILPEITGEIDPDSDFFLDDVVDASAGSAYTVKWNGTEYNCIAQSFEIEGISATAIGNLGAMTGNNPTGEPFLVVCFDANTAAMMGAGGVVYALDNSTSFTLSINGETTHKIDKKYLPPYPVSIGSSGTGFGAEMFNYAKEASGNYSHAEGAETTASGDASHAEGNLTTASGDESHAEGYETTASGDESHAEGWGTTASGNSSHAEGWGTTASGSSSHAEGYRTEASGAYSHAEGRHTEASGDESHAEGWSTEASGQTSHAEGGDTTASGDYSHAEGYETTASGKYSHAEGHETTASEYSSHAEGYKTTASNQGSHAEGWGTTALGNYSHAEGYFTYTRNKSQHVQGEYNAIDPEIGTSARGKYAHIVGNGTSNSACSNAHTLDWSGNAWFAGDVYVGSTSGTNKDTGSKKLATEEFVETEVAALVGSAPEALDTIEELATALNNNKDIITVLNDSIATKANKADVYTKAEVDALLANYYTKAQVDAAITAAIDEAFANIVRAENTSF